MSKEAFLKRLRELLAGIPDAEAAEAIQYYEDYFADAGQENEARVIEELGTPEKVADNIRKDLGYGQRAGVHAGDGQNDGSQRNYSTSYEYNYEDDSRYHTENDTAHDPGYGSESDRRVYGPDPGAAEENVSEKKRKSSHTGMWIVIAICTCFIWFPLAIVLASVMFGIAVAILAIVFSLGVAAFALIVTAIVLIAVSLVKIFFNPAGGMILLGGGLFVGGLSILGIMLVVLLFGTALPAMFRGIGCLFRKIFRRGGSEA